MVFEKLRRHLDLQAKIIFVLIAVIVPTFVIVTIAQNQFMQPVLEEEVRQLGVTSGMTLAAQIVSSRLLSLPNPTPAVEDRMQELLYSQPDIVRMDVIAKDPATGALKVVATNVVDEPGTQPPIYPLVDAVASEYRRDDSGVNGWDILVPIEYRSRDPRGPRRLLGTVHLLVSTKLVEGMMSTFWRTTATAAGFSVVALIAALTYFLRKTLSNDRLLKRAESQNLALAEQLHEAERQLMNTEKLAVMGQLTASFAHEIGTPLNAVGGHLQLLQEEVREQPGPAGRLEIVQGQLAKIENIVKGFLQSTSKPASQTQLVDMNLILDKTLGIVRPRIEAMGVRVEREFDRGLGPVRAVPLDFEQVFLNLVNNSLDGMRSKRERGARLTLQVGSRLTRGRDGQWAEITVYDTGEGIPKGDLDKVLKPFFTTKRPGEGTGLGLAICRQLVHKYGGELAIDSKEGAWTRVTVRIPYHAWA